jgi:hypothetical protein
MFIRDADPSFKTVLYAVYTAYVLIVAFLVSRSGHRGEAAVIDGALLLISMLMLSPMSSESHSVALMLANFVVTAMWLKGDADLRLIARYLLILSFLLINTAARDIEGMVLTTWAEEHRPLVIDALLLLVPFALFVHRMHPATQPHPRFDLTAA